jgi:glycosyltransferase involved in cell wall biosynthesis
MHIVALQEMLQHSRIDCAVMNLTRHRRVSNDQVLYPNHALEVLWLLLRRRDDILHFHIGGRFWPRQLGLGLICALLPGRRLVLTFHSGGFPSSEEGRRAHRGTVLAFFLRRFDRLIAVNQEIAAFFERLGVGPHRIRVISPHAIPLRDLESRESLPHSVGEFIRRHRPLLLTVSGLEEEYDVPLQIRALREILKSRPSAGLLIIGGGSLEEQLRQQVETEPHRESILLCGELPHAVTLKAIAQSDIMLRTTKYDGDAISVREGLHFGLPVIATDNGMRPPGVHLIPVGDASALRTSIEEVLTAQPLRRPPAVEEPSNLRSVLSLYDELLRE